MIDVLHHLTNYEGFLAETRRVLAPGGKLFAVTDSADDIGARSLTHFFPETLAIERSRYPNLDSLQSIAQRVGLEEYQRKKAQGELPLTEDFVSKLENRCASSLRLISDEAHRMGIERVRQAAKRGKVWRSRYTIVKYRRIA